MSRHYQNLKPSTLRIIGGQWRGRRLRFEAMPGLRPTGDRIRETLFNWLTPTIVDACCLDLFAGTGSLGLESLSRGAAQVWLLEKHAHTAAILAQSLQLLSAKRAKLIQADSINWLATQATAAISAKSIDTVFIDPPFGDQLWEAAVENLIAANILAVDALIYIEAPHRQTIHAATSWELLREKTAGAICYRLYRNKD